MILNTLDGRRVIKINAIDSRLKQAVDAESLGLKKSSRRLLKAAIRAERDLVRLKIVIALNATDGEDANG